MLHVTTASLIAACAISVAACGENLGTSVELTLVYDDGLQLDTAEITAVNRTQSGAIAHRMVLLVPDALEAMDMPIEVWGMKTGRRAAYGTSTAVPARDRTVAATVTLTACSPGCQGAMLTTCTSPPVTCPLGCTDTGTPHCRVPTPSNGVDPGAVADLRGTTTIAADTVFNTDTGEITGGLVRVPGVGDGSDDGVGYLQPEKPATAATALGVFAFHDLTVAEGVTVRFTGRRAAVLLVGDAARIAGTIDVSGGHGGQANPGPGGGVGGTTGVPAEGCGAGQPGNKGITSEDSGGGGGGGRGRGGAGGIAVSSTGTSTPGGAGGEPCLSGEAQTMALQGGSGGGRGSPGAGPMGASDGGGGGGALQITALGSLEITGTIQAHGAGGQVGGILSDAGGGGGGGGGGAILVEAPVVTVASTAILAANGGGGGGGSAANGTGERGQNGQPATTPAPGGANGFANGGRGGNGGAGTTAATPGGGNTVSIVNASGGGGAVGTITVRGLTRMISGVVSPPAVELDLELEPCSSRCQGDMLITCTGLQVTCEHGCSPSGEARCAQLRLANGIEADAAAGLTGTVTIAAATTFDSDTGEITGGLVRAPGAGDGGASGVRYLQRPPLEDGGAPLGVFVVANLTIQRAAVVQFTGARAAVIVVGDAARIAGTIDVSGGRGARSTPGPGGGAGAVVRTPATGCGAGGPGTFNQEIDTGGGGAGGGGAGGRGSMFTIEEPPPVTVPGGAAGASCQSGALQVRRLAGGSGGGAGSSRIIGSGGGGGGGGAVQITALGSIAVSGTIHAGGGGGVGGVVDPSDSGAGSGGGSGGAIVLEAPAVTLDGTAILAANGGGGGGGASSVFSGSSGENGRASAMPALGGAHNIEPRFTGGNGGAGTTAATRGGDGPGNGNGGGGGVGTITIRGGMRLIRGIVSPPAVELDLDIGP